jgi:hypothetical protein
MKAAIINLLKSPNTHTNHSLERIDHGSTIRALSDELARVKQERDEYKRQLGEQETSFYFTKSEMKKHNELTAANAIARFVINDIDGDTPCKTVSEVITRAQFNITHTLDGKTL